MKRIVCIIILLGIMVVLRSGSAWAGEKMWSVETGYVKHRFIPRYSYASGRPDSHFTDRAYGVGVAISGRYIVPVTDTVSLPLQCSVSVNDAKWCLDTGEPAQIEYSLPYNYDVSFLPTWQVTQKISPFLEAGIGQGYIKEKKESPATSAYNFSQWTTYYVLGCGATYKINEQVDFFVRYRHIQYNNISYGTYLADGSHVETVSDQPSTQMVNVGLLFSF